MDVMTDEKQSCKKGSLLVASFAMEKGKESKAIAQLTNKKCETSWLQEDAQEN